MPGWSASWRRAWPSASIVPRWPSRSTGRPRAAPGGVYAAYNRPARPHLRLRLRHDGHALPAIGFGLGELLVRVGDRVDVVFRPRLARWQGTERLELEVLDVRGGAPGETAQVTENAREFGVP